MNLIIIYTDGACLGNPGVGAWSAVVRFGERIDEIAGRCEATTNNRMELMAVIRSIDFVLGRADRENLSSVVLHSDSSYVINGASKWIYGWKARGWKAADSTDEIKNRDLWQELDSLLLSSKSRLKIEWRHIKGHAGILGNERCDRIANSLASGEPVDLFSGLSSDYPFELEVVEARPPSKSLKKKGAFYYLSLVNGKIYRDSTWAECEARVKGRAGVKFKKCYSREEEAQILKDWKFTPEN